MSLKRVSHRGLRDVITALVETELDGWKEIHVAEDSVKSICLL
jgi:hypothetical protein